MTSNPATSETSTGDPAISIRRFVPADAEPCLALFRDTIRRVNIRDYTPAQINAWAPSEMDSTAWANRFRGRFAYVAVVSDRIAGFTDMTNTGYLDRLFVSADHQRCGIASRLIAPLFNDAISHNLEQITADVSITAKPFFERMGFVIVQQKLAERHGETLTNFKMRLTLGRAQNAQA
ncbi:GNAT family N-acetyltransferase [Aporhodopirellula aestuarii]|uniref:GNAT family N-acetyltransferase n=1 Tax=Aporhodopirellula aestuarii TaxID=2950107 RepID=A0ABT0U077_9BACT|nr:GNAT family N-acetyltransferase [Aporhodopirellula aestuarii]MCM2370274.1 GNAT family N-acetyltransferase [Aporhodopirellula aestuarii]